MRYRSLALLAGAIACCAIARADAVYAYVGGYYDYFSLDPAYPYQQNDFTTSDRVTGFISFAQPLAPNLNDVTVLPIEYSFSDGITTRSTERPVDLQQFADFSTDGSGHIIAYDIVLADDTYRDPLFLNGGATGNFQTANYFASIASGSGGGFTSPVAVETTPEPSSFALLGTGLLGVAGVMKRRFA